jgi:hypothetical protein
MANFMRVGNLVINLENISYVDMETHPEATSIVMKTPHWTDHGEVEFEGRFDGSHSLLFDEAEDAAWRWYWREGKHRKDIYDLMADYEMHMKAVEKRQKRDRLIEKARQDYSWATELYLGNYSYAIIEGNFQGNLVEYIVEWADREAKHYTDIREEVRAEYVKYISDFLAQEPAHINLDQMKSFIP